MRLPAAEEIKVLAARGVRTLDGDAASPLLLLCEHGGRAVPARWADLGLGPELLASHFGSDPGAAAFTERLSALLRAPAVIGAWSRLFLDLNRHAHDWQATRPDCAGIPVPGNRGVCDADRAAREAVARAPFDAAVARLRPGRRILLSVHTCTPIFDGFARPWPVGVLWLTRDPLAARLIAELAAAGLGPVGDNEPYDWRRADGYTLRAEARAGVEALYVEVRNDLLVTSDGVEDCARRFAAALAATLAATLEAAR